MLGTISVKYGLIKINYRVLRRLQILQVCDLKDGEILRMKNNINATIIVPHYNSYNTLRILLNSIGLHKNLQIIVVDDHSANYVDELKVLKDEYPNVEFYQNNQGHNSPGTCRNIGLQHANGEWVLFADADDYFEADFYSIVEKYFDVEEDMIIFPPTSRDIKTKEISDRHLVYESYINAYLQNPSIEKELALRYKFEAPWSKMIKRGVIQRNSIFFDTTPVSEDVMFSVKCGYYCRKIYPAKDIIYCCTKGENTLTSHYTKQKMDVSVAIFCNMHGYLKDRLAKDEFKMLNLRGAPMIYNLLKDKHVFGRKYIIIVICRLIKKGIPIITSKDCSMLFHKFSIYWILNHRE